ncbi:hypothetical protein [Methanoregula sp.]|uniref:hypothetical protein n=1 Tax=Methanoregula sp. TaxID=2052170 RepID=UPI003BAEE06C
MSARSQVQDPSIAPGHFLNGAKSPGFDSCPMGGFDPDACAQILGASRQILHRAIRFTVGYTADR